MSTYSTNITREVNTSVSKSRGPLGKQSRRTTYNHLLRTHASIINPHIRHLMVKRRHSNISSRVDDPYQMKWFLDESRGAIRNNLSSFQGFSSILKRKTGTQPSVQLLTEFIVFILGCPQNASQFGADIISTTTPRHSPSHRQDTVSDSAEDTWDCSSTTAILSDQWDISDDTPTFDDEEDHIASI